MKKKISYIILTVILIIGAIYFYRYKMPIKIANTFPKGTKAIVSINLRQLEHHFLADVLSNPSLYLATKKKSPKKDTVKVKKKKQSSFFKEISIPKNIQFFTKDEGLAQTWISSKLQISNNKTLATLISSKGFEKIKTKTELTVYEKKGIYFIIDSTGLRIAYSNKKAIPNFATILNSTELIAETSLLFTKLKNNNSDICYLANDKDHIDINFTDGKIDLKGFLNFDILNEQTITVDTTAITSLAVNINKKSNVYKEFYGNIKKDKFKRLMFSDIDSISEKWTGKFRFELLDFATDIDSIVTYEYDDNFNKTEKITVQKTNNPNFNLELNTNKNLWNYLESKNTIDLSENKPVFKPFPLLKTFIESSDDKIRLFTKTSNKKSEATTLNKLSFHTNFTKYRNYSKNTMYYFFDDLLMLDKFDITISKNNELSATILMNNEHRNALTQLVKFK